MTTPLYLNHFDYYVPENKVYLQDLSSLFDETIPPYHSLEHLVEFAQYGFGLDNVRVEDKISLTEALRGIIKRTIDSGILSPRTIDYILMAPVFHSSLENFGHTIQHEFGMRNAKVVSIGDNYSVNMDMAIELASKLMVNTEDKEQNILIVGGDFFGTDFKRRIISDQAIAADNASILLVSNKNKGARFVFKNQEVVVRGQLQEHPDKVDNMALHYQSYCTCLEKIMSHNQLKPDDIKKIITHNGNLFLVERALSVKNIGPEKIFRKNRGTYGHLGGTDLPLNLFDFSTEEGNIGDRVISLNMGISGTYIASLFERIKE